MIEDLAILEAQHGQPGRCEPVVARVITKWWRKVAGAIGFDHKTRILGEEVDDEGSEWLLPAKLCALELASAQPSPELSLRGRLRPTQCAGPIGPWTEQTRHRGHVGLRDPRVAYYRRHPSPSGRGDGGEGLSFSPTRSRSGPFISSNRPSSRPSTERRRPALATVPYPCVAVLVPPARSSCGV